MKACKKHGGMGGQVRGQWQTNELKKHAVSIWQVCTCSPRQKKAKSSVSAVHKEGFAGHGKRPKFRGSQYLREPNLPLGPRRSLEAELESLHSVKFPIEKGKSGRRYSQIQSKNRKNR